jgi:hypothetical protein
MIIQIYLLNIRGKKVTWRKKKLQGYQVKALKKFEGILIFYYQEKKNIFFYIKHIKGYKKGNIIKYFNWRIIELYNSYKIKCL